MSLISIVVPCFNEETVVAETHAQLSNVLSTGVDEDFELIYVDDASGDRTLEILKEIRSGAPYVKIVSLSRNFGQQVAVSVGLEHASGNAVVIMDADLQDPPELIVTMLERWRSGVDVVYAVRNQREGEGAWKRWSAKAFYRVFNVMSEVPIPLDTGYFRLMDRRVVDAFLAMPERGRFVRGMLSWVGFRQEPIFYRRNPRYAGSTKYSFIKMCGLAIDGVLSFSMLPLRFAAFIGLLASSIALLGVVYALTLRLMTDIWVPGWTLLFIAVLFLGGIQLVFLGVLGEYIGRVYREVKQRPLYVINERIGFSKEDKSKRSILRRT